MFDRFSPKQKSAETTDAPALFEKLGTHALDRPGRIISGVVNCALNTPLRGSVLEECHHRCFIRGISRDRCRLAAVRANVLSDGVELGLRAPCHQDVQPFLGEAAT